MNPLTFDSSVGQRKKKIGAYKSGGFGDMADYTVLLSAVRAKHPDAHIRAFMNHAPSLQMLSSVSHIDAVELVPSKFWGEDTDVASAVGKAKYFDLFYDFRPYVARCYRGIDALINLKMPQSLPSQWRWEMQFKPFYDNPLSQYQNVLPDHFPQMNHLEITALSCDLPTPDWGSVKLNLPRLDWQPPKGAWASLNLAAFGADKGMRQTKMWSVRNWQDVVDGLQSKGVSVVQCGVGSEPRLRNCSHFWNSPIMELLAFLQTAPLHLAVENGSVRLRRLVTDNPSVVLFGPTHPDFYGLPGNVAVHTDVCRPCFWLTGDWMVACPRATETKGATDSLKEIWSDSLVQKGEFDRVCMRSITPEMVIDEVSRCLNVSSS